MGKFHRFALNDLVLENPPDPIKTILPSAPIDYIAVSLCSSQVLGPKPKIGACVPYFSELARKDEGQSEGATSMWSEPKFADTNDFSGE